jgi:hypothetical protein
MDRTLFRAECPENASPEVIRRIHKARMRRIDTHKASDRDAHRTMVGGDVRQSEAKKALEISSNIRKHRASTEEIARYLWSRDAITEPEAERMENSVSVFIPAFKRAHWKHPHPLRHLRGIEIPDTLANAILGRSTHKGPQKIVRAFNASDYYTRSPDPPPPPVPDVESLRRFHAYVAAHSVRPLPDNWAITEPASTPGPSARRKHPPRPPLYTL